MRSLLLALLMLVPALAGCSDGKTEAPPEDLPSSVVVQPEEGLFVAENRGILRGRILDADNFTVPQAHVSVLATDRFTDSDGSGRFVLTNLTLGDHQVRIEKEQFLAVQIPVTIRAGQVTDLEVRLEPAEGLRPRPHPHNFWGGSDVYTLMDHDFLLGEPGTQGSFGPVYEQLSATYVRPNQNGTYRLPVPDDGGRIVIPGTAGIDVTASWDTAEIALDRFGLVYSPANDEETFFAGYLSNGQPLRIPVAPEAADGGHQAWSLWEFWVFTDNNAQSATEFQPAAMQGPLHVRMDLLKGDIPVDPPHPDYWNGSREVVLRDKDKPLVVTQAYGAGREGYLIRLEAPTIVPPEATTLRVEFEWAYQANDGSPVDQDYVLTWRTAAMNPQTTDPTQYVTEDPVESGDHSKVYDIDVRGATDAYYQQESGWVFAPCIPQLCEQNFVLERPTPREFRVRIVAYQ